MNGKSLSDTGAALGSYPLPNTLQGTARTFLGGKISTFRLKALPVKVAIFCPKAGLSAQEVDILVYAHGLLDACSPVNNPPEGLITGSAFQLGQLVDASKRPLVVVAPLFDWSVRGFHFLGKPASLNTLVADCMQQLAKMLGRTPGLSRLILAGHSRGYDFLEPLARANADPQMKQGALAKLSEVWAFDTTYVCDTAAWLKWLASKPGLRASVFYRRNAKSTQKPLGTMRAGDALHAVQGQAGDRLKVTQISAETGEEHCQVPVIRLREVLGGGQAHHQPRSVFPKSVFGSTKQALSDPGLRAGIVKVANAELARWGHGAQKETDPAMHATLAGYWSAVLSDTAAIENAIRARTPWSAAFISWVMREAGAGAAFSPASAHSAYIAAAKKFRNAADRSKFWAYRVFEARPEIGDLIGKDRKSSLQSPCSGTDYDNVERGGISHCDVVVAIDQASGKMTVLGGNVSNSVKTSTIQLTSDGRLPAASREGCKFITILKPPASAGGIVPPAKVATPTLPLTPIAPSGTPHPPQGVGHCVDDRCTSTYIRWMQAALAGLGFKLKATGSLDDRTMGAILRFKRRTQLKTKETYVGETIERGLVAAGAQPPPPLTKAPCGATPAGELIPLLNKNRGDIPLDILLGWAQLESGRQLGSSTSLCERGYFQLHPGNSIALKVNHDLVGTDKAYSVRAGIALVNQCRRYIATLGVPAGSEFYWRLVKLAHWIPSGPRKLFAAMRKQGVEPRDWEAIEAFVKKDDDRLKRYFKGRRPSQGIQNVNNMFRQVEIRRQKLSSPISAKGAIQ